MFVSVLNEHNSQSEQKRLLVVKGTRKAPRGFIQPQGEKRIYVRRACGRVRRVIERNNIVHDLLANWLNLFQGRKKACIFLTPDCAFLTFLQGFQEKFNENHHKQQMKYVQNMLEITLFFRILLQPI